MIFVKNSRGGREVNMINTVLKIDLSNINTLIFFQFLGGGALLSLDLDPKGV